jgi:UDP-N-acetylmuramyl pentapeptide phosphotransferase/UDP-N-acetylglucosamine-1-phosphate transferase
LLYWLLYLKLYHYFPPFRIFRYLTFRTAFASLTALFTGLIVGPIVIRRLRDFQIGQYIREEGPQAHQKKAGTPTMGGLLIAIAILVPTLLWADLSNPFVWIAVLSTIAFGAVGFADDYLKVVHRRNLGLTARAKIGYQIAASVVIAIALIVLQHPLLQAIPPRPGRSEVPGSSAALALGLSAICGVRCVRHCGFEQRRKSYRRPRRPRHRLHGNCSGRARRPHLPQRTRHFCRIS